MALLKTLSLASKIPSRTRRSCRGPTPAQPIYFLGLATNVYECRSTNVHVLLTDKFRAASTPSTSKSSGCLQAPTVHRAGRGPLYTSVYIFLDAWVKPYGQAVRARAAFQILKLFDYPSLFSIIVVRNAALMLVGCHNGVVTRVLVADAVLCSLPLEPARFNPHESWEDSFEGTRASGGRGVSLTLRRTKLLSQPQQYNSTQLAWH